MYINAWDIVLCLLFKVPCGKRYLSVRQQYLAERSGSVQGCHGQGKSSGK